MIWSDAGRPLAGVRYYLTWKGERMGATNSAKDAMEACDRNPGMVAMAEVFRYHGNVEKVEPQRQVYPIKGVLTNFPF